MVSWLFGSGRVGVVAALIGGTMLCALAVAFWLNPEWAVAIGGSRRRSQGFGLLLICLAAIGIKQFIDSAKTGRIPVGAELVPQAANPSLFRWHRLGHLAVAVGFAALGIALLR